MTSEELKLCIRVGLVTVRTLISENGHVVAIEYQLTPEGRILLDSKPKLRKG